MQRVSHAEALTVGPLLAPLLPLGVAASARPAEELARTFAGARVALLLVGQAFRGAAQGECETGEHAVAEQRELASLYVRHVCEPLEALDGALRRTRFHHHASRCATSFSSSGHSHTRSLMPSPA